MRHKPFQELPQDIVDVRARIELWRRTRPKQMPMPQELWQAAASLTPTYGLFQVAKALHLNHSALKMHASQLEATKTHPQAGMVEFLEWPTAPLLPHPAPAECVVELARADGARLTIRLPATVPVDLVGLSDSFWRRAS